MCVDVKEVGCWEEILYLVLGGVPVSGGAGVPVSSGASCIGMWFCSGVCSCIGMWFCSGVC